MTSLPVVAIVGRPNVGKSALFNRIVGRRRAIVHEQPGVTRDRVTSPCDYDARHFLLVDTGGLGMFPNEKRGGETYDTFIRDQVEAVLQEASLVIFVTDTLAGMTPLDQEIANFLRKRNLPLFIAANKTDSPAEMARAVELFSPMGVPVEPTSAVQGLGIGDLLFRITRILPCNAREIRAEREAQPLRLAVVGRPNAGKSSLVNQLAGESRMIVSDVPGTTRDAVDIPVQLTTPDGLDLPAIIIDTAGLRPKHKIDNMVERFSVMRAEHAIKNADLILFMIDASSPPTAQDRRIASLIGEARKPCLMLGNKIDLLPPRTKMAALEQTLRRELPFMEYAPLVPLSAKEGKNIDLLKNRVARLSEKMNTGIPTAILNQFLRDLVARTPPPAIKGKHLKLFYCTMVSTPPPHMLLFVNHKELGTRAYSLFLENRTREAFFPEGGMPVTIEMRSRTPKPVEARETPASERKSKANTTELSPSDRRKANENRNRETRRREFRAPRKSS